jgi:hypothetical protein
VKNWFQSLLSNSTCTTTQRGAWSRGPWVNYAGIKRRRGPSSPWSPRWGACTSSRIQLTHSLNRLVSVSTLEPINHQVKTRFHQTLLLQMRLVPLRLGVDAPPSHQAGYPGVIRPCDVSPAAAREPAAEHVDAGREGCCVSLCVTPIGQPCIVNQ